MDLGFLNRPAVYRHTVESTMIEAAPLPVGSIVVAGEQTAGLGRHGHEWQSEANSGLYVSLVLDPHPVLTLALGIAAAQAIAKVTSLAPDIRWPNDLMLAGKKLGGVLVQLHEGRAIAGIGLNVTQKSFPGDIAHLATSLYLETNLEFRREDLLAALLDEIDAAILLTTPQVIQRFEEVSTYAKGKAVRVDVGDRTAIGVTAGLDSQGFLLLKRSDGVMETVVAGGVRPL